MTKVFNSIPIRPQAISTTIKVAGNRIALSFALVAAVLAVPPAWAAGPGERPLSLAAPPLSAPIFIPGCSRAAEAFDSPLDDLRTLTNHAVERGQE